MIKIPDYTGAGVYAIMNLNNKKVYVGSSQNIRERALSHRHNIAKKIHSNPGIRDDSGKGHTFAFTILEKAMPGSDLLTAECLYMLVFVYRGYTLYNCDNLKDVEHRILNRYIFDKDRALDKLFMSQFGTSIGFLRTRCTANLERTFELVTTHEEPGNKKLD